MNANISCPSFDCAGEFRYTSGGRSSVTFRCKGCGLAITQIGSRIESDADTAVSQATTSLAGCRP